MNSRYKAILQNHKLIYGLALWLFYASALADVNNSLTGYYYGTATINSPANIGIVDLAFYLDVTGSTIQDSSSYIDVEKTLLFPTVEPAINSKAVGPRVYGTFTINPNSPDLNSFDLYSKDFPRETGDKSPVTRQIHLVNSIGKVTNKGASIEGTYTETVKNMTSNDLVISGSFRLMKPVVTTATSGVDLNGDGCLELSEIRAGGADPDVVEFGDVSAAMNLYNHPRATLKLGPPPNCANDAKTLQDALNAFYGAH